MHRIALLPLAIAASTLACNLLGSDEPDSPLAAESDSSQPVESDSEQSPDQSADDPLAGESSEGGPEFLDLDDPLTYEEPQELLSSYRIALRFAFDGVDAAGSPVQGAVTAEGERWRDAQALSPGWHVKEQFLEDCIERVQ